jgi:hypothetical protein
MPALTEHNGLPKLFPVQTCLEVDMDHWGYSDNQPLSTVGAGPCMNVVVHRNNAGCLAHIWNMSTSQTELYHHACFSIKDMIDTVIGGTDNLNIWLGAGTVFRLGSKAFTHDRAIYDFGEYLENFLGQMGCAGVTLIDHRLRAPHQSSKKGYDPGNVVYDPPTGCVYLLESGRLTQEGFNDDSELHGIQTRSYPAHHIRCF